MNKIRSLLNNKIVYNAGWLIIGKIGQSLVNLVVGILTARYLGPANYGLINYAAAYVAFFTSICTLGINSVIVKEFVDAQEDEGTIIGTSLGLRAISSVLSVVSIICLTVLLDKNEPETQIVVALYSVSLLFSIYDVFTYRFHAMLQSKNAAITSLIAYFVTAIYKVILLILGKPVTYFALATSIDYLCIALIHSYIYIRSKGRKISFSWGYGKQLLLKSCHYILSSLMVSIYAQTDKFMLKQMIGETENGYYSTAVSLCSMWCFILSAIIDSVNPVIMQAYREDENKYNRLNCVLYRIIFYICVVVSIFFVVCGDWIVNLLYGEAYLPATAPLKIITWYTAFSYLGVARNAWIVCENKQKYLKYVYASAAAANVLLNLFLIPIWGASGAAMASLMAQVVTIMIAPLFIPEMQKNVMIMLEAIFFKKIIPRNRKEAI